jgi:hypothetical protein
MPLKIIVLHIIDEILGHLYLISLECASICSVNHKLEKNDIGHDKTNVKLSILPSHGWDSSLRPPPSFSMKALAARDFLV